MKSTQQNERVEYWGILNEGILKNFLLQKFSSNGLQYPEKSKVYPGYQIIGRTAIIEVFGIITSYDDDFTRYYSLPTIENIYNSVAHANASENIDEIVFMIDSPGGVATGFSELTDFIFHIQKKTAAIARMACSAAYFLAAATKKIYASETSILGSIGVMNVQYAQDADVIITVSKNAPLKNLDASTDSGKQKVLSVINDMENTFLTKISSYRGVPVAEITEKWGRGGELTGSQAISVGMIDNINNSLQLGASTMSFFKQNDGNEVQQPAAIDNTGANQLAGNQETAAFSEAQTMAIQSRIDAAL